MIKKSTPPPTPAAISTVDVLEDELDDEHVVAPGVDATPDVQLRQELIEL